MAGEHGRRQRELLCKGLVAREPSVARTAHALICRCIYRASGKESACQFGGHQRWGYDPWVRKIPWRRAWQPTPVFLPRESRSLVGYNPWGRKELDTTEWLTRTHTVIKHVIETRVDVLTEGSSWGAWRLCGGSLYLTSLVHFLCHMCKFFLNISLICIFKKKSFLQQYSMMKLLLLTQYLGSRRDSAIIGYIPSGALASVLIFWPCS